MDIKTRKEEPKTEEKPLLAFLKATKEGQYAKVEETSLPYSRIKEEAIIVEGEYYYGIR